MNPTCLSNLSYINGQRHPKSQFCFFPHHEKISLITLCLCFLSLGKNSLVAVLQICFFAISKYQIYPPKKEEFSITKNITAIVNFMC